MSASKAPHGAGRAPIGAIFVVTVLGVATVAIVASVFALVLSRT